MSNSMHRVGLSYLIVVAGAGALGGLLFGYDTAVISGAIDFLQKHFQLTDELKGLAASSLIAGAMAGTILAGPISDRFGRRPVLLLSALLFAVSGVGTALSASFSVFVAFRLLGGIGIGAVSVVSPLYIAEISPGRVRGQMVALYQLAIVSGIVIVFFINYLIQQAGSTAWDIAFGWRWMFASLVIPSILLLVMTAIIPESPRWLVMVGRTEPARLTMARIGGQADADEGIARIQESIADETGSVKELLSPAYRRPLLIGALLAMLCQFSGINAIMYFAPSIFSASGAALKSSFLDTILVGVVNLLFTFVAIWLVDRTGRRSLLIAGSAVQVVALLAASAAFHFHLNSIFLLLPILLFIAAFASGMGPIPWVIISEIFPTKIRGSAMATATVVLWASDFLVAQSFPVLNQQIGPAKTFIVYSACSLIGLIVSWKLVVETKGRTLEEIDRSWRQESTVTKYVGVS